MSKKLFLAILLIFVSAVVLTGCNSKSPSGGLGGTDQNRAGQVSDSQGAASDPAGDSANVQDLYVRSDNGEGGVQVEAVWVTPEYLQGVSQEKMRKDYDLDKNVVIEIAMTTHMGDLTQYPISNNAELTVDGQVIKPAKWDVSSDDPHHPLGLLVFPADNVKQGSRLQLTLRELNGVPERTFDWLKK